MANANIIGKLAELTTKQVINVFEAILSLVRNGEKVNIRGFGTFFEYETKPKKVVSPLVNDGEPVRAKPKRVMKFKSSKITDRYINENAQLKKVDDEI
jgi:nucleoid DNA-binding protein